MSKDFTKHFWKQIYKEYPNAYKAYMERNEKTDIITDFFDHYKIYVEFRDLELTTSSAPESNQVKTSILGGDIQHIETDSNTNLEYESQLKNQNYLNN